MQNSVDVVVKGGNIVGSRCLEVCCGGGECPIFGCGGVYFWVSGGPKTSDLCIHSWFTNAQATAEVVW